MKRAPTAKVKIETCHIDMIADSGSTVNIMSHKTYQLIQPVPTLKSAKGEKLFHKEGNFNNREVPMHFRIKGQSQSWGFMSRSTARVILGQVLRIATCGTRTHRGDSL